jgi:hypothetical protein
MEVQSVGGSPGRLRVARWKITRICGENGMKLLNTVKFEPPIISTCVEIFVMYCTYLLGMTLATQGCQLLGSNVLMRKDVSVQCFLILDISLDLDLNIRKYPDLYVIGCCSCCALQGIPRDTIRHPKRLFQRANVSYCNI